MRCKRWRKSATPTSAHSQVLQGPSEHEDLVVVGEHHLHEQVDWGDGVKGHLATSGTDQVGAKHDSQVTRCHFVEVTSIHHLQDRGTLSYHPICVPLKGERSSVSKMLIFVSMVSSA